MRTLNSPYPDAVMFTKQLENLIEQYSENMVIKKWDKYLKQERYEVLVDSNLDKAIVNMLCYYGYSYAKDWFENVYYSEAK